MQPHRIPSLNWLRVFDAAARHQSFASAGRELNMSAAAVSQQILALETYLKKPLFLRSANKVRLTLEGNEFLPTIQVSLRAIEAKSASLFPRRDVERVSLVASQLMAMSWLPRRLTAFEKKHPSVRVDLITEDSQRNGEPDLAIRFDYVMTTREHPGWLMGISHVVVGQPQDVERITTAEAVMDYKLLDVRSHAVGWNTLLSRDFRHLRPDGGIRGYDAPGPHDGQGRLRSRPRAMASRAEPRRSPGTDGLQHPSGHTGSGKLLYRTVLRPRRPPRHPVAI
ncbi:LysR family transcriptional regulator [Gluconobacter oxydans]|uniref:LysR family transcriptional regulator n=1 Tax=Gluconobacter oxydans TaxID=442 RepID=UPI000B191C13|nr:LysR family transcriptional regulator [Gluconobacter oxydans]